MDQHDFRIILEGFFRWSSKEKVNEDSWWLSLEEYAKKRMAK